MHFKRHLLSITLFLLVFPSISWAQGMQTPLVVVDTLQTKSHAPQMKLKANVVSLNDALLSSEVEGRLEFILAIGSTVEKGQTLARLNNQKLQWQVQRAEAELASAKADLIFRQSELERFQRLAEQDNASKTQLQREMANKLMVEQQIKSAQANLAQARRELSDAQLISPFSGVVVERLADVGEYIRIGEPLLRLVDDHAKELVLGVPIKFKALITTGMELRVEDDVQSDFFPVSKIVPVSNPETRMIEVRIDVTHSSLTIGDAVSVYVPTATPGQAVSVPKDALVIRDGQSYIYIVDESSVAKQVPVTIKYTQGSSIVVNETLAPGSKVVIRGAERLQANSTVQIIE